MSAWWCEAEGEAGGFLTGADGAVLEVRGRWPADSADSEIVKTVAGSLKPLAPVAESFQPL